MRGVRTLNLGVEPFEGGPRQLLIRRPVGESISNVDVLEELEDGALHRQFVQIGVEEGDDPLWEGGGAVEIHVERRLLSKR